ncbi:MAG: heavy-metal-associated domain-containing protein [Sphingomonadaceae bacterium]|uniref:heavy-metal-associated domain-containing protein n=1 Tax=Thermaurantiacus sp. TaxID=2820283 RepID=UPI00298F2EFC|nr:heavy-metal-associated domain-containing protein [Thermaurantiacus sp.]MCS6986951.1 heavy-metal-associated domain-containing protein [Sphingomonadaceae bacterium]MDW8415449.1 heavy-metal-associated domain-containing protein [Thermaurantiacus sp.]
MQRGLVVAVAAGLGLAAGALAQPARAPDPVAVGDSSGLVVGGIEVLTSGRTNVEARFNGWREAQRKAWPLLWSRYTGLAPERAPRLSDAALDSIVSAIEIEEEAVRDRIYGARLSVVFDRLRSAAFLGGAAALVQSPPLLLLPVLQDAGARMGYEPESPWVQAWLRFRAGESAIDYIRLRAGPLDRLLLSAWQAERADIALWRRIVDRYQVADVLVPELILERDLPGRPVQALLILRSGPGGRELGRLRLAEPRGDVAALLDRAVREADARFTAAFRAGLLKPDPALAPPEPVEVPDEAPELAPVAQAAVVEVEVEAASDQAFVEIERRLRATPGILGVEVRSFVVGGISRLGLRTTLPPAELAAALAVEGLALEAGRVRLAEPPPPAPGLVAEPPPAPGPAAQPAPAPPSEP